MSRTLTSAPVRWIRRWWPDALGGLLAVIYAMPSLWYPFAKDHPIHWYIAQRLLEGELPYVSALSTKPPGVFVVLSAATVVLGDSMATVRIVDLVFLGLVGWLAVTFRMPRANGLVAPARSPGELGAAWVLAATFHYTFFDFSDTGHPELWQGTFMLASLWLLVRSPDRRVSPRRALAAGAVAMCAVTFKHVAFTTGVLAGGVILWWGLSRREAREPLRNAALFSGAVFATLGLVLLPWALSGAFDVLWESMVEFILRYARKSGPMGIGRRGPIPFLTYDHGLFATLAAAAALVAGLAVCRAQRNRHELRVGSLVLLSCLVALLSIAIQKRALYSFVWTYYFVTLVPFLVLAVSWGLRAQSIRRGLSHLAIAVSLMAAFFWYQPKGTHQADHTYLREHQSFWPYLIGRRSAEEHHAPHRDGPLEDFNRLSVVGAYINTRAQPGDTLCVDGWVMMLYQMTELRCPSRFLYGDGARRTPEWRAEYRQMLQREPPTFFVTFGLRPRVRQLMARGYTRHDIEFEDAWYTVLERPRDQ